MAYIEVLGVRAAKAVHENGWSFTDHTPWTVNGWRKHVGYVNTATISQFFLQLHSLAELPVTWGHVCVLIAQLLGALLTKKAEQAKAFI